MVSNIPQGRQSKIREWEKPEVIGDRLANLIAGDEDAWQEFVAVYLPLLQSVVFNQTQSRSPFNIDFIDDITGDIYYRLIKGNCRLLRRFDPRRSRFSTWLAMVARSAALDHWKGHWISTIPIEAEENLVQIPAERTPTLAIPRGVLTRRQALIFKHLYIDGLSVKEIAARMRVASQTIYSAKSKIINKLRRHFRRGR